MWSSAPILFPTVCFFLSFFVVFAVFALVLSILLFFVLLLSIFCAQAKEAEVSKDMESLRSSSPDSPVFKILEQVKNGICRQSRVQGSDGTVYPDSLVFMIMQIRYMLAVLFL